MIRKIILTTGIALLGPNSVFAEQGDVLCEYHKSTGLRAGVTEEQKRTAYGTGFIANSKHSYIQKYDAGKKGPKEAVTVTRGPSFVSYKLKTDVAIVNMRTYADGRCYLQIHKGGYEPIWFWGRIVK